MAVIDIRAEDTKIDEIVFGSHQSYDEAYKLVNGTYLEILTDDCNSIGINRSDVPYLIKALQKAVELGWTK